MQKVTIESKHISKSVSAWGGLILLIPIGAKFLGLDFTSNEVEQLTKAAQSAEDFYLNLMALIGAVQLVIGRFNAKRPLHLVPGVSFEVDARTFKRIPKPVNVPADVQKKMDEQDGGTELF